MLLEIASLLCRNIYCTPDKVRIIMVVVACRVEDMNGIWNLSFLNLVQMIWSFQKQIESRNIHAFWKLQKILWDFKIKIFNISEPFLNARQYSTGFTYSKFFSPQNSHMCIFIVIHFLLMRKQNGKQMVGSGFYLRHSKTMEGTNMIHCLPYSHEIL